MSHGPVHAPTAALHKYTVEPLLRPTAD